MQSKDKRRRGFTLIEILVVVVIIGILVALLLPALLGAVIRARETAVSAELNSLSTALISFKSVHGYFPPSRVVLSETGDYSPAYFKANLPPQQAAYAIALTPRSLTYFRKIWPRVAFSASTPPTGILYDFDGNGIVSPPVILQGHECLTFFLGGIPQQSIPGKWFLSGFSLSPSNPFQGPVATPNRSRLDYDFDINRLIDSDNNGFPEYLDSYGGPTDPGAIVYFSGYEGQGYDPDDVNMNEPDDQGIYPTTNGAFSVANDPTQANVSNTPGYASSPSPNPYLSSPPTTSQVSWQKASTFQLITCGRDRIFGISGQYDPNATNPLPFYATTLVTGQTLDLGIRNRERDNLSSFNMGRLAP